MDNARLQAVKLLGKTFSKGGYSNILLDKTLTETSRVKSKNFVLLYTMEF